MVPDHWCEYGFDCFILQAQQETGVRLQLMQENLGRGFGKNAGEW